MNIRALNSLRFRNITQTPAIKARLCAARNVIDGSGILNPFFSAQMFVTRQIVKLIDPQEAKRPGVYFCFGGDLVTLLQTFPNTTYFCFDARPFINPSITDDFSRRHAFGAEFVPDVDLMEMQGFRTRFGYMFNQTISLFGEVGVFTLLDILAARAEKVKVFQAESETAYYKITFDLRNQRYRIFVIQHELNIDCMPELLSDAELGFVLIKGGKNNWIHGESDRSYRSVESIAQSFLPKTLFISDQLLDSEYLEPVPFSLDIEERVSHLFSLRPAAIPFGYSEEEVFLYRVGIPK
ncbi:MAG: hypothetical protein HQ564_05210 [Candidatus Saganbacteria bacterium]|nr:hypothetical protein [Candidatus Saganbacteria bacterium]